jgi:hypothetical protein
MQLDIIFQQILIFFIQILVGIEGAKTEIISIETKDMPACFNRCEFLYFAAFFAAN